VPGRLRGERVERAVAVGEEDVRPPPQPDRTGKALDGLIQLRYWRSDSCTAVPRVPARCVSRMTISAGTNSSNAMNALRIATAQPDCFSGSGRKGKTTAMSMIATMIATLRITMKTKNGTSAGCLSEE
jgi:hypothetical protein